MLRGPGRGRVVLALCVSLGAGVPGLARAAADDLAQYRPNAVCVAAIEHELKDEVAAHETPTEELRRQWLGRMEAAFAIIGQSYRRGLREPRASELLEQARDEVEAWPASRRRAESTSCVERGGALLAAATSLERYLLERAAQRRLERFLARQRSP